jgi:hypothetical protein
MEPQVSYAMLWSAKMRLTDEWLQNLYDEFNCIWFDSKLPACKVSFRKGLKTSGLWELYEDDSQAIYVCSGMPEFATCITLLHEMIHVSCEGRGWADHVEHGESFRRERHWLLLSGAFDPYL